MPAVLRDVVQGHVGTVTTADRVDGGSTSDIALILNRDDTIPVYLKGVKGISPRMRWLRNEITAAALTSGLSPRVLFAEDLDGADGRWLLVGFEYVPGQPVNLAPGSADLPLVAAATNRIGTLPGGATRPLRDRFAVTDWWRRLADTDPDRVAGWDIDDASRWAARFPELADGDRLVHNDLHADQFLTGHGRVRVIDWGYPGTGAPWVDPAFLILRLIEAGHTPTDAETWARTHLDHVPDDDQLTAFAVYIAGLWGWWAATGDLSGSDGRARIARDYARARTPVAAL